MWVGIRFANAHYPDLFVVKSMIPNKLGVVSISETNPRQMNVHI